MTGSAVVNFLLERRACRDRSQRDLLVRSATYRLISIPMARARQACPSECAQWRDLLVRSAAPRLMIHPDSSGTTSAPLQFTAFGGTRLSRPRNTLPAGLT